MTEQGRSDRVAWEGEMFRLLAENVRDYALFVVDTRRHVLTWSKGAEHLLGFSEEEIVGKQCDCFFTAEDVRDGVPQQELDQALASGRGHEDRWHVRKDGSRFWSSGVVAPLLDEGGTLRGFAKIMRDRSDLKRAEDMARARERQLRLLTDHAPVLIAHIDTDRRYRFVNKPYAARFGRHPRDIVGKHLRDVLGGPAYAAIERQVDAALSGRRVEFEAEIPYGTLGPQVVRCAYDPELDAQGRLQGFVAAIVNVTDQQRVREALAASRRRLQALFDNTLDAILLADDQARYVDANPAACQLLGYDREALEQRGVFDVTPPPNGEAGRAAWTTFLRDGQQAGEYAVRRNDGTTVVVEYRAVANILPGLHLSVLRDVSERRRTEEALRESERRFRTLATCAPVGIFQTDADGHCVFVNDRWCRITGLSPHEAAGEGWVRALHPDDRVRVRDEWYAAATAGREFAAEYRFRTPQGRTAWVHGQAVALRDEGGAITGHLGTIIDTTEQKKASEALRESEQRLRAISDNLPLGAVYQVLGAPDGRRQFTYISGGLERLLGVTPAEALADAGSLYGLVHEEDRDRVAAAEEVALRDNVPFDCEFRSRTRDGDVRWVHARSAPRPLPTGQVVWEGILMDRTDRKRAEQALTRLTVESERLRRLYETALSNTADFNYTFDLDGRLTYANKSLLALWGKELREAVGRNFFDLGYPPELADRLQRQLRQVIDSRQPLRDETPYDGAAGKREYEYIFVPVVGARGAVEAVAGSTRDITDHKALEVTLRDQAERLREADRRKDEFLATLAHELRNPLAPIRNAVQVLRLKGSPDPAVRAANDMIDRQVCQMVRLVDDLLDVSRITQGKLQLRKERVELSAVVRSAVETARPLIEAANHQLAVALPSEPVVLDADPVRLAQVFANLLTNAAKYTDRAGRIRLTAERHGGEVVVAVKDTGIGIPAEQLPRLFEMFSQVASALDRSQGGLGIGLSLVKGLTEMHAGRVEARSEGPGRGSEFIVRLPLPVESPGRDLSSAGGAKATHGPGRRVLVVDDNRDAADSLGLLLRLQGHETHAAHDGPAAVAAAERFRPEVVLLDIGLPGLNGYAVARRIREELWGAGMVLVAITGWGQEEDRRRAMEAGFDEHLTKPVAPGDLEKVLAAVPRPG